MKMAIDQAVIAEEKGNVPVGCVIVKNDKVIAKVFNQREQLADPTAHAEIIALIIVAALEDFRVLINSWMEPKDSLGNELLLSHC